MIQENVERLFRFPANSSVSFKKRGETKASRTPRSKKRAIPRSGYARSAGLGPLDAGRMDGEDGDDALVGRTGAGGTDDGVGGYGAGADLGGRGGLDEEPTVAVGGAKPARLDAVRQRHLGAESANSHCNHLVSSMDHTRSSGLQQSAVESLEIPRIIYQVFLEQFVQRMGSISF